MAKDHHLKTDSKQHLLQTLQSSSLQLTKGGEAQAEKQVGNITVFLSMEPTICNTSQCGHS